MNAQKTDDLPVKPRSPDLIKLGRRMKSARERAGLKQPEVAEKLCVQFSTVSGWETGYREVSFSMIRRLASLYRVPVTWLLDIDNHNEDNPPTRPSPAETQLLDYYRATDLRGQRTILTIAEIQTRGYHHITDATE